MMIILTPREEEVLQAYKELRSMKKASEQANMSQDSVRRYLIDLVTKGLAQQLEGGRYAILDVKYTVMSYQDMMKSKAKGKHVLEVAITPAEKEWTEKHYKKYQRNRGEAARILGRSRFDICLMAQVLGVHIKDGEVSGKVNKGRSA